MATRFKAIVCGSLFNVEGFQQRLYSVKAAATASDIPTIKHFPHCPHCPQINISHIIKSKIKKRERFFGVEVSGRPLAVLDYADFKVHPLFTTTVWNINREGDIPLSEAPAFKLANILGQSSIVMPSITCYKVTTERLKEYPLKNFKNALLVRGDRVDDAQQFKSTIDLIREMRKIASKDFCIAVAAYPDVHPFAKSKKHDFYYLKQKVDSGADLIITQFSFSANVIVDFIKNCRKIGIEVPIIPGVFIPKCFRVLNFIGKSTKLYPPVDQMKEYKRLEEDKSGFEEYALDNGRKHIQTLLESDAGIYGIHLYCQNYFGIISKLADMFTETPHQENDK